MDLESISIGWQHLSGSFTQGENVLDHARPSLERRLSCIERVSIGESPHFRRTGHDPFCRVGRTDRFYAGRNLRKNAIETTSLKRKTGRLCSR